MLRFNRQKTLIENLKYRQIMLRFKESFISIFLHETKDDIKPQRFIIATLLFFSAIRVNLFIVTGTFILNLPSFNLFVAAGIFLYALLLIIGALSLYFPASYPYRFIIVITILLYFLTAVSDGLLRIGAIFFFGVFAGLLFFTSFVYDFMKLNEVTRFKVLITVFLLDIIIRLGTWNTDPVIPQTIFSLVSVEMMIIIVVILSNIDFFSTISKTQIQSSLTPLIYDLGRG